MDTTDEGTPTTPSLDDGATSSGTFDAAVDGAGGGGGATGVGSAIVRKVTHSAKLLLDKECQVKKVVDMRLDAPELAVALKELSEFYGPNTLENRRNLRSSIERRGVEVSKRLVSTFGDVMKKLDMVEGHVAVLAECSTRMQQRIQAAHATTSQVPSS
ncbi:hypothetical protein T484DRAFT_1813428 [Baffinella frigidus]|nr:hypothetical protein T484DRAFT_1813428 [Cryptophyta sp. CCMP2293]